MRDSTLKMIFGFALLVLLAILAAIIAVKHVEQQTSYGLEYILGALSTLAGGFAAWAFTAKKHDGDKGDDHNEAG